MADEIFTGSIEELTKRAEAILKSISPDAWCMAQEWDNRIDCLITLPDGKWVGEMIPLQEVSDARIRACGDRLEDRRLGGNVLLQNEWLPPILIVRSPK